MSLVRMVQVSLHHIIYMIAVRYRLVSTALAMQMAELMSSADMACRAGCRICRRHLKRVFVKVTFMRMMQMPVMQVIHVALMQDRRVAAVRAVYVRMPFVYVMRHNIIPSLFSLFSLLSLFSLRAARLLSRLSAPVR